MSPDTHWFLTDVRYLEKKKCISAEFSNREHRRTEKISFFPKLLAPKEGRAGELVREILSTLDPQKSRLEENKNAIEVSAATYSDLKRIRNALYSTLKVGIFGLEPERQFLLDKNWSYFDCFSLKGEAPEKTAPRVPNSATSFTAEPLDETIEQLAHQDIKKAKELCNSIGLSNLLRIPLEKLSDSQQFVGEIFLENAFFRAGFPKPCAAEKSFFETSYSVNGVFSNVVEFDFSGVWVSLLTFPFFNIGVDSLNCSCCKPDSPFATNILPSSIAEVKFLQDAVYFESTLPSFSEEFHKNTCFKEKRIKYKQDFFLQSIPAGPFSKNDKVFVPMPDIKDLKENSIAEITGNYHLQWKCEKKESFISKEINHISKAFSEADKGINNLKKNAFEEHGLAAEGILSENADFLFLSSILESSLLVQRSMLSQLQNHKSAFFLPEIAKAINAIKHVAISEFRKMSSARKERFIYSRGSRAFVKSESPLQLAQSFAETSKLPVPKIAKNHRTISFRANNVIGF